MEHIILVLLLFLVVAVIMDFLFDKICNEWILLLLVTGTSYSIWQGGVYGLIWALLSMAVPAAVLYPLFMTGGLGAGDVKLLAVIGSFLKGRDIIICMAVSFLIGAVFSLLKMAAERNFLQRMQYLLSYLHDVFKSGSFKLYAQEIQDRKERKKGKIHFALPVFISVMLFAGGIY